ncbi:MAG: recombinase family protein [Acidaminococcaceae bacterium]|nr:recombinase family protein [Acidaminococcaceae bacterium]
MNAVIYARYSSSNQTEQSIEGQLRDNYAWAKQHDITVIDEYIDRALTGTKDNRPDFQRMIADAAEKRFEIVIVWKLDRFARNRYDSAVYKARLKKYGVKVVSVMENITDSPEGIILEGLLESMAEYYSANLSENTKRGLRESALKGYWIGGHIPFGYKLVDRKLVADEKTAPVVRYMFEQYAAGVAKADLISELAAKGVRTYYGKPLNYSSFNSVLRNRLYTGYYAYDGQEIEGVVERIIDDDVYWKTQEQIKARSRAPATRKAKVKYLLSGKAYCGICGEPMVGVGGTSRSKKLYHYYRCSQRKYPVHCPKKNERKDIVERFVVEQTLQHILTPDQMKHIAKAVVIEYKKEFSGSRVSELKAGISKIETELEKLVDTLIDAPKLAHKRIYERMETLELQKADMQESYAKLNVASKIELTEEEVEAWLEQFRHGSVEDVEFCRKIIDTFVNSVYMYDDRTIIFYNIRGGKKLSFDEVKTAPDTVSRAEEECSYLNTHASVRVTKYEHYYVFVSGVLGLVVMKPDA